MVLAPANVPATVVTAVPPGVSDNVNVDVVPLLAAIT